MVSSVSWDQQFFDPIELPDGRKLVTLRDAAEYISALPEAEHALPHWVTAIECLMLVAEHNGPPMFARIAMMQAMNSSEPNPTPRRKRAKVHRIVQRFASASREPSRRPRR
jgi:hypothetical protein